MNYLSKNITFLRKRLNISQQMLAESLHLSRSNIASYESGKAEPKAIKLVEMARYFDVSLTQLIEADIEKLPPKDIRLSNANIHQKLSEQLAQRKIDVQKLKLKMERQRKVAVGFRALYELKMGELKNPSEESGYVLKNMESLLDVIDSLVASNEELIAYLDQIIEE